MLASIKINLFKRLGNFKSLIGLFVFCFLYLICAASFAATAKFEIDIYRTNQISAKEIRKKFGQRIKKLAGLMSSTKNFLSKTKLEEMEKLGMDVLNGINSMGNFERITMASRVYPKDKTVYFSIDIVDKKDIKRLSYFLPKPKKNIADPEYLIEKWMEYQKTANTLIYKQNKRSIDFTSCPAHHCVFGFEHPELIKYKNIFKGVPKNKRRLVAILRHDKNENKRAAAAFLLAHLEKADEVIKLLSPSIFDSSVIVRNNAMRVIGVTLISNKSTTFPIEKIMIALDFPAESERNKALLIISSLVEKNLNYVSYIKKHANVLLNYLKMSQRNQHDTAYFIFQKISGKNFADRDYKSWEQWVKSIQ